MGIGMSRQLHKLNALQVSRLDRIGRHGDGGGLYLSIGKDGRRRWVFIYRDRRTKRLREMGLGSADIVPLAKARERAKNARELLSDGLDPIAEREGNAGGGAHVQSVCRRSDRRAGIRLGQRQASPTVADHIEYSRGGAAVDPGRPNPH